MRYMDTPLKPRRHRADMRAEASRRRRLGEATESCHWRSASGPVRPNEEGGLRDRTKVRLPLSAWPEKEIAERTPSPTNTRIFPRVRIAKVITRYESYSPGSSMPLKFVKSFYISPRRSLPRIFAAPLPQRQPTNTIVSRRRGIHSVHSALPPVTNADAVPFFFASCINYISIADAIDNFMAKIKIINDNLIS